MQKIINKRSSIHKRTLDLEKENTLLKDQINQLKSLANAGLSFSLAAHEINNVLTPIGSYAQLALANPEDIELTKKVQKKTVNNCHRAQKIIQNLLNSVNKQSIEKANHSITSLVNNVFDCIARDFKKDGIRVDIDIEEDLGIYAVDVDIEQLLMNLILNARDAMVGRGGTLTIKAFQSNGNIVIIVSDTGKGIEQDQMLKIFTPFYTTKSADSELLGGNGLGLSYCKQIVDSYDGSITVESKQNVLTSFKITFPKNRSLC